MSKPVIWFSALVSRVCTDRRMTAQPPTPERLPLIFTFMLLLVGQHTTKRLYSHFSISPRNRGQKYGMRTIRCRRYCRCSIARRIRTDNCRLDYKRPQVSLGKPRS
ncbi:uncharacterized protein LAESUDRAFT_249302 [Laetiporus sulphureus 93-53]|uniref:Uncharacterized protein n=1 Tax=Laetiporus sulphureus 93-53 TaxID=1314785 RepID=A0A165DIQ3_9APHY|nr:uncharacterized protein LAESUDRAFT_249302 [Laetiporus sulphureus 93-53]KZT04971.1 hypothetical protein LAESUDRAFT_249302 [Laetiporus sulphureus 93-53]